MEEIINIEQIYNELKEEKITEKREITLNKKAILKLEEMYESGEDKKLVKREEKLLKTEEKNLAETRRKIAVLIEQIEWSKSDEVIIEEKPEIEIKKTEETEEEIKKQIEKVFSKINIKLDKKIKKEKSLPKLKLEKIEEEEIEEEEIEEEEEESTEDTKTIIQGKKYFDFGEYDDIFDFEPIIPIEEIEPIEEINPIEPNQNNELAIYLPEVKEKKVKKVNKVKIMSDEQDDEIFILRPSEFNSEKFEFWVYTKEEMRIIKKMIEDDKELLKELQDYDTPKSPKPKIKIKKEIRWIDQYK